MKKRILFVVGLFFTVLFLQGCNSGPSDAQITKYVHDYWKRNSQYNGYYWDVTVKEVNILDKKRDGDRIEINATDNVFWKCTSCETRERDKEARHRITLYYKLFDNEWVYSDGTILEIFGE